MKTLKEIKIVTAESLDDLIAATNKEALEVAKDVTKLRVTVEAGPLILGKDTNRVALYYYWNS